MEAPSDEVVFESTRSVGVGVAEFAAWAKRRCPDDYRCELLNGKIVMTPPASYPHGEIESAVQAILYQFVHTRGLGRVLGSSQGYELPTGDTVEPDASYVSNDRWRATPAPVPGEFLRVVPDLVVEILSASTAARDRGEKKAIYERNGVNEYWLVDSTPRELTVFVLHGARYGAARAYGEKERVSSGVLADIPLLVADVMPAR